MYYSYRFHANNVQENLAQALKDYWGKSGKAPKMIAVNPRHVTDTQALLNEIGLAVEIKPIGGCLINEVWLEV